MRGDPNVSLGFIRVLVNDAEIAEFFIRLGIVIRNKEAGFGLC